LESGGNPPDQLARTLAQSASLGNDRMVLKLNNGVNVRGRKDRPRRRNVTYFGVVRCAPRAKSAD
jgi:hypothetical protein